MQIVALGMQGYSLLSLYVLVKSVCHLGSTRVDGCVGQEAVSNLGTGISRS